MTRGTNYFLLVCWKNSISEIWINSYIIRLSFQECLNSRKNDVQSKNFMKKKNLFVNMCCILSVNKQHLTHLMTKKLMTFNNIVTADILWLLREFFARNSIEILLHPIESNNKRVVHTSNGFGWTKCEFHLTVYRLARIISIPWIVQSNLTILQAHCSHFFLSSLSIKSKLNLEQFRVCWCCRCVK